MDGSHSLSWMREDLERLKGDSRYRELQTSVPAEKEGWIVKNEVLMLNLASNHYLGLNPASAWDPEADSDEGTAMLRIPSFRRGATASRLIVGNDPIFEQFEQEFARFKGTESCLLFSSGYMANVGILSALLGREDAVFSDRLNHASIVDGIVLSRAKHRRYPHQDLERLEHMLRKDDSRRKLIVTDAVFSMDGTTAPLKELVELKERCGAMLMIDEAHSGGIYGPHGEGLAREMGLEERIEIQMGTFSKAYGGYGAYVAGDRLLTDYLVNHARSFIYTTALPPALIAAVRSNWQTAVRESWRRSNLRKKAAWFRGELQNLGFDTGGAETQIVPVIIGDNARAVEYAAYLQDRGIAAVAIRPPTVPEGSARIRFTLMAVHTTRDLQWALEVIAAGARQMGLIP